MDEAYEKWYREFSELTDAFDDDELYSSLDSLINASRNTFAFNKKIMEKAIDVSWVEAIENGILHVDNFLRSPRRTIEDVEEVVPIALSKKITVESVKHLSSLFVDNFALCVHHVVVTEHLLSYGVVSAFDETLRLFDLLGDDTV